MVENRIPRRYHDYFTRHVQKLNILLHGEKDSQHSGHAEENIKMMY